MKPPLLRQPLIPPLRRPRALPKPPRRTGLLPPPRLRSLRKTFRSIPTRSRSPKIVRAKGAKNIVVGIAHIFSTFNNTSVTITDLNGNVIGWSSAGKVGFKGSRKSTAYAAQMAAQDASVVRRWATASRKSRSASKGPGAGRESAVRALQAIGLEVTVIRDVTPVPHNGCRPPKQRRV